MSFRESAKIGKPGNTTPPKGLIYKVRFYVTGVAAQINNTQFKIAKDSPDADYVFNTPASPNIVLKATMSAYNVSTNWSLGSWNGNFRLQFGSPFETFEEPWDFTESPNCTAGGKVVNNPSHTFLKSKVLGNDVSYSFQVTNDPNSQSLCETAWIECINLVSFPGLSEGDITINEGAANLVSVEKL